MNKLVTTCLQLACTRVVVDEEPLLETANSVYISFQVVKYPSMFLCAIDCCKISFLVKSSDDSIAVQLNRNLGETL